MLRRKRCVSALWGASLLAVGICCFLIGKAVPPETQKSKVAAETTEPTEPKATELRIMPEVSSDGDFRLKLGVAFLPDGESNEITYSVKGADESSNGVISCCDVQSVSISVDGEALFLEDAIQRDRISLEEMFAYARLDARDGLCEEWSDTTNGLTYFYFRYPEYDLRFAYDIYEVPDGSEYLFNEMLICKNAYTITTIFYDIDREDWGLAFEAVSAANTTLTLRCEQSGGQQIGGLIVDYYYIMRSGDTEDIPRITRDVTDYQPKPAIAADAVSEITIDWMKIYGELEAGDYTMQLMVTDVYDPEAVHPLMRNYYDTQSYDVSFSIP